MSKVLLVSSAVQAALLSEIFIPEITAGFWKDHRPAGHGEAWKDVEVKVTEDGTLGPVGFELKRTYNFLNPEFSVPNADRLVQVAQTVKESSTLKSVKKELTELSRIVAGRLTSREAAPVKLFRGNHKAGTVTVSSAKARAAGVALAQAAAAGLAMAVADDVTSSPAAKTPAPKDPQYQKGKGSTSSPRKRTAVKKQEASA